MQLPCNEHMIPNCRVLHVNTARGFKWYTQAIYRGEQINQKHASESAAQRACDKYNANAREAIAENAAYVEWRKSAANAKRAARNAARKARGQGDLFACMAGSAAT